MPALLFYPIRVFRLSDGRRASLASSNAAFKAPLPGGRARWCYFPKNSFGSQLSVMIKPWVKDGAAAPGVAEAGRNGEKGKWFLFFTLSLPFFRLSLRFCLQRFAILRSCDFALFPARALGLQSGGLLFPGGWPAQARRRPAPRARTLRTARPVTPGSGTTLRVPLVRNLEVFQMSPPLSAGRSKVGVPLTV